MLHITKSMIQHALFSASNLQAAVLEMNSHSLDATAPSFLRVGLVFLLRPVSHTYIMISDFAKQDIV